MKKLTVGLDVDGVLKDFASRYLDIMQTFVPHTVKYEDIHTFDTEKANPAFVEYHAKVLNIISRSAQQIEFYPEAIEGFKKVEKRANIIIVTALLMGESFMWDRYQDLHAKLGISFKQMIYTSQKHLIDVDCLIDDKPSNCLAFAQARGYGRALMFDQPWNRQNLLGVKRVKSWEDILNELDGMTPARSY